MTGLFTHLFLLRELAKRDFKGRYAGSFMGLLWSFVQPLWQLLLFTFVFSTVMKIPLRGERTDAFGIFLFCGLLPWMAISEGVLRGTTAITDSAELVKKMRFPSEMLVFTVALSGLLHEAIAAGLFVVVLAVVGQLAWQSLPLLLLALPLQTALVVGLGLLLAGAHVFFRDTAQILGMLLMGWFYFTPIVYPLSIVPERYRGWVELNPLTALVGLYRAALLGGGERPVPGLWILVVSAVVSLIVGGWLFRRLKPTFADQI